MSEVFKGGVAPVADAGGDAAPADVGAPAGPDYPSSWRAEDRQHWDAAPEDVRKIIAAREGAWGKERDGYKSAHENWSRYQPIFDRHKPLFEAEGVAPELGVQNVLQLAHDLRFGDAATKKRILGSLNNHYGEAQKKEWMDPEIGELYENIERRFGKLEGGIAETQKGLRGYMEEETKRMIDAFAKNPERKHFDKLSPLMGKLISGGMASGLDDAYDMAAKLTPGLSLPASIGVAPGAADVAKQHLSERTAEVKAAQSRQALQAAGVNVRGNGVAPPGNKPKPTLRKSLEAQYDKIAARN